ncbi:MAG TPA: hypothetical protein VFR90_05895 [Methylibium sp.]|uniref:hypothetical protein n=1 Tax=Methylibium sp. TaxID=2067992 RepID=UPI002DB5A69D|nr:hypothetical protein [Methylibium sp.]HEU4458636.1 hypothetical protein [Methylibium sp.]
MNKHRLLAAASAALAFTARAHEGHGLPGAAHWHASDSWGWIALAVIAAAALAWGRRK